MATQGHSPRKILFYNLWGLVLTPSLHTNYHHCTHNTVIYGWTSIVNLLPSNTIHIQYHVRGKERGEDPRYLPPSLRMKPWDNHFFIIIHKCMTMCTYLLCPWVHTLYVHVYIPYMSMCDLICPCVHTIYVHVYIPYVPLSREFYWSSTK